MKKSESVKMFRQSHAAQLINSIFGVVQITPTETAYVKRLFPHIGTIKYYESIQNIPLDTMGLYLVWATPQEDGMTGSLALVGSSKSCIRKTILRMEHRFPSPVVGIVKFPRNEVHLASIVAQLFNTMFVPWSKGKTDIQSPLRARPLEIDWKSVSLRFWANVNVPSGGIAPDDCVSDVCCEWTGGTQGGYGSFYVSTGNKELAHRLAYKLTQGVLPDGAQVKRSCKNKLCCNPTHLTLAVNPNIKKTRGTRKIKTDKEMLREEREERKQLFSILKDELMALPSNNENFTVDENDIPVDRNI